MSTDYGFRCRDCKKNAIIDNCRSYQIETLQGVLDNLSAIQKVKAAGLTVHIGDHYYGFGEALSFAIDHRDKGHTVVIADEYGREHDQCPLRYKCPVCAHSEPCGLKRDHSGDCGPA